MGGYVASSGNYVPTFRDNLSVRYSSVHNRYITVKVYLMLNSKREINP